MDKEAFERLKLAVSDTYHLRPIALFTMNKNEDPEKMLYTDFLEYYNVYCAVDPQMVRVCLEYAMKGTTSADCNVANPCDPDDILNLR